MSRRRRRAAEEAASHDRWLISYADFITLLFAFFVVLFASAYRDNHSIMRVSRSIHDGFQKLGAFSGNGSSPVVPAEAPRAPQGDVQPVHPFSESLSPAELLRLRQQLQSAMGTELKNHEVELRVTPEGFVISLKELGFFDSGQAALLPGAAGKIRRIAAILEQYHPELRIEGHSDNQPIHNTHFRSNWELSTARATTVLQLLIDQGSYSPEKLSVAGYGQYRPLADDSTAEGRRMNRRVDLVVLDSAGDPRRR